MTSQSVAAPPATLNVSLGFQWRSGRDVPCGSEAKPFDGEAPAFKFEDLEERPKSGDSE
ncbi:MAG: hypothetical protein II807_03640 [Thermoguttaceae bacterium]|nr:hypothetical protein [Thermoguttaceae bacterium]